MNNFGILQALVFEPKKAFAAIAERPRVLFPLLLLLVTGVGVLFWYFSIVDIPWLIEKSMDASGRGAQMSDEEARAARSMGPIIIKWASVIGALVMIAVIRLGEAVYFLLAGKITNVQRSFKQWLSLSLWTSMPAVLGVIPAAIVLFTTTTTQFDQGQLQTLSLNNLLFHRTMAEPGYSFLSTINLFQLAGLYLAAYGVKVWSGRSWVFSTVFAVLPWALIMGVWGWLVLGRA